MEPTKDEIRLAILKSIGKWKAILKGNKGDKGSHNCPLCKLFHGLNTCIDCPVYLYSGFKYCNETPHAEWVRHHELKHNNVFLGKGSMAECDTCKNIASSEIDFLRDVLVNWKEIQGDDPCTRSCCQSKKTITIRINS